MPPRKSFTNKPKRVLIVDNGAHTIKVGFVDDPSSFRLFSNYIYKVKQDRKQQKIYISNQINDCKDLSSCTYRNPFERVSQVSYWFSWYLLTYTLWPRRVF